MKTRWNNRKPGRMDMTLKTKLILGLAFLFLIIFTLSGLCSYYVGKLSYESGKVLKDNYYSLVYTRNMLSGLDDMKTSLIAHNMGDGATSEYGRNLFESGKRRLETNLRAENNNITETYEKEWVDRLNRDYQIYLNLCTQMMSGASAGKADFRELLPVTERLKESIGGIYDVNMAAIQRKSNLMQRDSGRFANAMAIIGSICLVLAFFYFWYFPVYISTTLKYLADRMRQLLKNCSIAFDDTTKDEAFVILQGMNLLEHSPRGMAGSENKQK